MTHRLNFKLHQNANHQKSIYKKLWLAHGHGHDALGWSNKQRQLKRFEVLLQIGEMHANTVLDVGCGLGDMYGFLRTLGIRCDYEGVDILPEFVEQGRHTFKNGKFICKNILFEEHRKVDFVLASGIFAYGDEKFFEAMVKRCFALSRKGFGFNVLSYSHTGRLFSLGDNKLVEILEPLKAQKIEIISGYLPNDRTVLVYH